MHRHTSLLLLLVSMTIAGCNAGSPPASPTPSVAPTHARPPTGTVPPSGTVDGRDFLSVRLVVGDPDHALVPGTVIRLGFSNGHLTANAGCNTMGASYLINGDVLSVGGAGVTEIGCQPDLQAQDVWLFAFLGAQPHLALSGNDLVLSSGATTINLLDSEVATPDQPLTGRVWTLNSISNGEVASSVPAGVTATITFNEDGSVGIQPGCNSVGGRYIVTGTELVFSELVTTDMACQGAAGQVEAAVVAVLSADAATFAIDAGTLTLTAGANNLQFTAS